MIFALSSQLKLIRCSHQPAVVPLHVVLLRDLGRAVAQEIRHLARGEGLDASIRLLHAVDQVRNATTCFLKRLMFTASLKNDIIIYNNSRVCAQEK